MTTAESNTARQTVEEFDVYLDAVISDAMAAGMPTATIRDRVQIALLGLEATVSATDEEKSMLVGAPVAPSMHEEEESL